MVVKCGEPAGRRLRAAEDIHDDVDAAEVVESALRDLGAARGCRDVRCDVVHAGKGVAWNRAGRGHYFRAVLRQHLDDRGADPFRPGRHERATTGELEIRKSSRDLQPGNFVALECEAIPQFYGTAGEFAGDPCDDGDVRPRDVYGEWLACIVILCRRLGLPARDGLSALMLADVRR